MAEYVGKGPGGNVAWRATKAQARKLDQLAVVAEEHRTLGVERDRLIVALLRANVPAVTVAEVSGLARSHVYKIRAQHGL